MQLLLLGILQTGSGVEFEEDNVTVFDDVVATLLAIFSGSFARSIAALFLEVLEMHDFGHDEAFLEVGVDSAGGLRCFRSPLDGPGLDLIRSSSEEIFKLQRFVAGKNNFIEHRWAFVLLNVSIALILVFKLDKLVLPSTGKRDNRSAGIVLVNPFLDLDQPLVLLADEVLVRQVHQINHRLRSEK